MRLYMPDPKQSMFEDTNTSPCSLESFRVQSPDVGHRARGVGCFDLWLFGFFFFVFWFVLLFCFVFHFWPNPWVASSGLQVRGRVARPAQVLTVARNPAGIGRSPCRGVAVPVSRYPGSLFLVFFLLVGVLWDTPGTGVNSSQWSTSPVCLFLLFLSFPGD